MSTHPPFARRRLAPLVGMALAAVFIAGCGESSEAPPASAPVESAATPSAAPSPAPSAPTAGIGVDGVALYRNLCGMCHGNTGKGDGPLAAQMNPRPRGFVDEPWRFIDPAQGEQKAIGAIIRKGISQAGMPPYPTLSDAEVDAIAAHVLTLRGG
jgi:high-affinity iron transporter